MPSGPSVMVLPGSGKNFDQFRSDDLECKQYATEQVKGVSPNQASITSGAGTALLGSALGAIAGAAIGGGTGAAIGAGTGAAAGGIVGTSGARTSGDINQQRYDAGYMQCMYAKGNRVPLAGQVMENSGAGVRSQGVGAPPPPPAGAPPPSVETPSTVGGP
jgi:outer membrane lipoprotein SlyB